MRDYLCPEVPFLPRSGHHLTRPNHYPAFWHHRSLFASFYILLQRNYTLLIFLCPPPFCSEIEILSKDGPEGHPYFCHSVSPSGDSLHNCSSRLRPVIWQVQCGSIVLPFCLMCIHLSDHHQVELLHWEISLSWALHHHEPQQPRISFPSRL